MWKRKPILLQALKLPGNRGGSFEVTKRSVYATHGGRAQLAKFCGMMGLQQPITTVVFTSTLKEIEISTFAEAEKCMSDASTRLKEFIRLNNPDKTEIDEEGGTAKCSCNIRWNMAEEGPYFQNRCSVCGICGWILVRFLILRFSHIFAKLVSGIKRS